MHGDMGRHANRTIGSALQMRINVPDAITTMRVAFVKQCDVLCRILLTQHQRPWGVVNDAAFFLEQLA